LRKKFFVENIFFVVIDFKDSGGDMQWYFSQVKGTMDEEVNEGKQQVFNQVLLAGLFTFGVCDLSHAPFEKADIISTVEFSDDGELLATGDKGGRIVIFQREPTSKHQSNRAEYNVYSTFQSHEAEFDYLKSLEIEEKINKIKWLRRKNAAHFLLSTNDKTVKLWKIRERSKRAESVASMRDGGLCNGSSFLRPISVPVIKQMDRIEVEAMPKRIFSNAHTYHINSISLNSDQETFMSSDDLRINLWHIEITNQSFSK
jgi:serine/threonine-protein phosphatase 2A regulatory subunit B